MPRTALPITTVYNTGAAPTATAIDPANHHVITPGATQGEELLVSVNNTFAGTKTVTIKAGANPPALSAGQGDLVVTCTASTNGIPIRVETSRFVQADGTINLDIAAAMTGTIVVYKVATI
jgi:hypothetical protein